MRPGDVILGAPVDGRQRARFRPLCGADELALFGCIDYPAAIEWMVARLADDAQSLAGDAVPRLSIADGDRLFAVLYRAFFGDSIELRQACRACPENFELSLPLAQVSAPPADAASP